MSRLCRQEPLKNIVREKIFVAAPLSLGGTLSKEETERNVERLRKVQQDLISKGYNAVSSCDLPIGKVIPPLRDCLKLLLECDTIYLLNGWEASRGAQLEYCIADELNMEIMLE